MRTLALLSLVSLALAGCSGGTGISSFLVTPRDVPVECTYATAEDFDFYEEIQLEYGWQSNPGGFDAAEAFGLEGNQTPQFAMLAILDCSPDLLLFSWSMAFPDAATAEAVAQEMTSCGDEWSDPTFVRGNIMGQFEMNGEWEAGDLEPIAQRMEQRLGMAQWCAETAA